MNKPYHLKFTAGPLAGRVLLVLARDELDAAEIVGRALREHALDTGPAIYAPPPGPDLFGAAPERVETITLDQAREALRHEKAA